MKYFVANWKANNTLDEAIQWVDVFVSKLQQNLEVKIIIAPPYPLLYALKEKLKDFQNIHLAAQDLSFYESGSYTGEVTAKTLNGLIEYVIIGHSERRRYFQETNETLSQKASNAKKYNIEPIYCIRNENDPFPKDIHFLAFESTDDIGKEQSEDLLKILELKNKLKLSKDKRFFYGGGTTDNNISTLSQSKEIDGFLIGHASLDPIRFSNIIRQT